MLAGWKLDEAVGICFACCVMHAAVGRYRVSCILYYTQRFRGEGMLRPCSCQPHVNPGPWLCPLLKHVVHCWVCILRCPAAAAYAAIACVTRCAATHLTTSNL